MLPDANDKPLLTVDELVQLVPSLGRTAAYEAIRRGEIPHISYGRKVFIPTARLRQQWGLDGSEAGPVPGPATATTSSVMGDADAPHGARIRAV